MDLRPLRRIPDIIPAFISRRIYPDIFNEMSGIHMSSDDYSVDAEELTRIGEMCKELKKEKDMLRESLLQEKSKNAGLIRRLESDANEASEARHKDKKYIGELERELRNCSQEIGYLQEQLNLRSVEADCMNEHVRGLELKLGEMEKLHDKFMLLNEELEQSGSERLILMQEIKHREEQLQNSSAHVEELETTLSSIALESQCEIESMKLDIAALEHRCFEAESFSQGAAQDMASSDKLLEEVEHKFQVVQERINFLEKENKELKEKNAKESSCKVEHLDNWLKLISRMSLYIPSGLNHGVLVKLREELMLLKEMGTCEEVFGPFISKLAVVTAWDDKVKNEMEKMSNKIHESELTINKLKEDLREEKQKAKEEAEDLIQAMAELRYQMTGMLEEECKRRACIEQTSLQRIQDLEAQVQKEQKKSFAAIRRFHEAHELARTLSIEARHFKNALEGLQGSTDKDMPQGINFCGCAYCTASHSLSGYSSGRSVDAETSDDVSYGSSYHRALIEWYPEAAPTEAR